MRKKFYSNNLFISIISTVVIGVICLVIAIGTITITSSKETFLEVFSESQKKIFNQIDSEFYLFYRDMAEITKQVSESTYVKNYLSGEFENQLEERNCILELKRVIDNSVFGNYPDCSILLAGRNGRTYMYKGSELLIMSADEIMQCSISLILSSLSQWILFPPQSKVAIPYPLICVLIACISIKIIMNYRKNSSRNLAAIDV